MNQDKFKVIINSFSYLNGPPKDNTGHGIGFVFDCRCLNNPGRFTEYKNSTGRDQNTISFLKEKSDIDNFMKDVYSLVNRSIKEYIKNTYTELTINFGCTGGQHRSVYCADLLAQHLKNNPNLQISLNHIEQNISENF